MTSKLSFNPIFSAKQWQVFKVAEGNTCLKCSYFTSLATLSKLKAVTFCELQFHDGNYMKKEFSSRKPWHIWGLALCFGENLHNKLPPIALQLQSPRPQGGGAWLQGYCCSPHGGHPTVWLCGCVGLKTHSALIRRPVADMAFGRLTTRQPLNPANFLNILVYERDDTIVIFLHKMEFVNWWYAFFCFYFCLFVSSYHYL